MVRGKKLDSLLISPPIFYEAEGNIWSEVNSDFPALGLASIAAVVREKGFSVKIIDCNILAPSVELFEPYFEKMCAKKYDEIRVIGITSMTCTIKKAYKIVQICKKYFPRAKIVFGGVHATFVTSEVIGKKYVNIVVYGEGELTFTEILQGKKLSTIKGIVYKKKIKGKQKVIMNPPRERITNLDALPMPAYDLFPVLKYRPAKGTYKRLPAMSMMTSRGCPGKCTFCSKALGNRLVFKSAKTIFKEIKYLIKKYGIKQILFYDDTFTVHRKNVIALCDLLIKNKIDISWTCFARVDFVDFNLLKLMKKAGCHQIMYGVENIDKRVLKNINKKTNVVQVVKAVEWTKKAKIDCRLAFMVGNPGDTKRIIEKNVAFVNRINPDLLIINITTPFPGTAMFAWAKKKDLILTYDWDDYDLAKPVMRLENLSAEQIRELYTIMYRRFYLRPSYMLEKLLSIRSFADLQILWEGFLAFLSFLKAKSTR